MSANIVRNYPVGVTCVGRRGRSLPVHRQKSVTTCRAWTSWACCVFLGREIQEVRDLASRSRPRAKCFGDEAARSPKTVGHPFCASTHQNTNITVHTLCASTLRPDDVYCAVWLNMSRPSAAAALRESFGDRRLPDISRKITACVSCRKLKVHQYGHRPLGLVS